MDDLVQDVFLETCRALPRFRAESRLSTFIGGIAVRVAKRAMRPSAWQRRRGPMPAVEPASDAAIERRVAAREGLAAARAALTELSVDKRVAFALWAFEGAHPARIAELTGASVSAVRSRIYAAQRHLQACAERDPRLRELLPGGTDV